MRITKYQISQMLSDYSVEDHMKYVESLKSLDTKRVEKIVKDNTYQIVGSHLVDDNNNMICIHVWNWECSNGRTYFIGDRYHFNVNTFELKFVSEEFDTGHGKMYSCNNNKSEAFNAMLNLLCKDLKRYYPNEWNNMMNYKFKTNILFKDYGLRFLNKKYSGGMYDLHANAIWLGDILINHNKYLTTHQGEYCLLRTKGWRLIDILKNPKKLYVHSLIYKHLHANDFKESKRHAKHVIYGKDYQDFREFYYHIHIDKLYSYCSLYKSKRCDDYIDYINKHDVNILYDDADRRLLFYDNKTYRNFLICKQLNSYLRMMFGDYKVGKTITKTIVIPKDDCNLSNAILEFRRTSNACAAGTRQFIENNSTETSINIPCKGNLFNTFKTCELIPILKMHNIRFNIVRTIE